MGYVRKEMYFPRAVEMWEYVDRKYGAPGVDRAPKRKATPKEIEAHNQRTKERTCRWKLRQHFDDNDVFVTLTYKKDKRPADLEECTQDCKRLMDRLRRQYKKAGQTMKWIRNIEVGTRGAWHVHLVIKGLPDIVQVMAKAWKPHGGVCLKPMWTDGEFQELAAYMTKTPKTDRTLKESKYSASQNLPVPDPVTKVYRRWKNFEDEAPKMIPKGWYVDKDSITEGITRDGFPYRRFQCFPLDEHITQKTGKKDTLSRRVKLISAAAVLKEDPERPESMEAEREDGTADNMDGLNGGQGDREGIPVCTGNAERTDIRDRDGPGDI